MGAKVGINNNINIKRNKLLDYCTMHFSGKYFLLHSRSPPNLPVKKMTWWKRQNVFSHASLGVTGLLFLYNFYTL